MQAVDEYIHRNPRAATLTALRRLLEAGELTEAFKWRAPCYTFGGKNVAMLASFKDNCALSFFKGALLPDPAGLLELPGPNSRSARLVRFTEPERVRRLESELTALIRAAVAVERSGQKIKKAPTPADDWPAELQQKFAEVPGLEVAFTELTPGRQRGYLVYFSGAKQSATRTSRIQAYQDKILAGKGFYDCTCGLSQRMPRCDGSHKYALPLL